MKKILLSLSILLFGAMITFAAAGHTEDHGGVMHKPGGDNPMKNCKKCHGSDLSGGKAKVGCNDCHENHW